MLSPCYGDAELILVIGRKIQRQRSFYVSILQSEPKDRNVAGNDRPEKRENAVKAEMECCHFSQYER